MIHLNVTLNISKIVENQGDCENRKKETKKKKKFLNNLRGFESKQRS